MACGRFVLHRLGGRPDALGIGRADINGPLVGSAFRRASRPIVEQPCGHFAVAPPAVWAGSLGLEPTGADARYHLIGQARGREEVWGQLVSLRGVQGALPPHRFSHHETTGSFIGFPGFAAFDDMVRKSHASPKVLESIRATARLAPLPPSGDAAPRGSRKPDRRAEPRAGPSPQIASARPSAGAAPPVAA